MATKVTHYNYTTKPKDYNFVNEPLNQSINLRQDAKPYVHTLGQVGHPSKGFKVANLSKRARSKYFTQKIVGPMLYLGSPLHKYYQRAWYCNTQLIQHGKKLTSRYCDTRICHVCNRIRTANMMNGYIGQLGSLDCLEFVTLTLPNVTSDELKGCVEHMQKTIVNVVKSFRRRGQKLSGVRKLEVTYNSEEDTYHPHFHMVTNGYGQDIVNEWLKRVPTASMKGQHYRPADQNSLNELFKYTTKIIAKQQRDLKVYISALDSIFIALKGKRCFQPFGIIKKVNEEVTENLEGQEYEDIKEYPFMIWEWEGEDWLNPFTKDTLTGYKEPDINFVYVT